MTKEQRDALFKTISDLSEMNRILNNQAKRLKIEKANIGSDSRMKKYQKKWNNMI